MLNPMLNSATPQYCEGADLSRAAYNKSPRSLFSHEEWEHPVTQKKYTIYRLPFQNEIYGYLLLPVDKNDHDIKVVFRGTDPQLTLTGARSALVNLEAWAPGFESFNDFKENVFAFFMETIKAHYGEPLPKLELSVNGHSQGGSLAQLFVNEFLRQRLLDPTHYAAFQDLVMNAFNSPGVHYEIAEQCHELARYQRCVSQPLKIRANYGMIGGDPVQTLGLTMLFANTPPEIAEVNVLKLDTGHEGAWKKCLDDGLQWDELRQLILFIANGILGTHPLRNFTWSEQDSDKYQFYSNTIPKTVESLRYELGYKTLVWPTTGYYIGRSFLREVIDTHHSLFIGTYNTTANFLGWLREKAKLAEDNQQENVQQEDDIEAHNESNRPFLP